VARNQEAMRLEPNNVLPTPISVEAFSLSIVPDDAKAMFEQAVAHKLDAGSCVGDVLPWRSSGVIRRKWRSSWLGAQGSQELKNQLLSAQSDTEAYYGRLVRARDFSRRAVDSAVRATPRRRPDCGR